ncbi:MAG: RdgB/HAM1 family non-canonical purine NTP pyrophosphatase [Brevinema sp.]
MKIFIATQNKHKINEITCMLNASPISVLTPNQTLEIKEGSTSYIENALTKANAWSKIYSQHYLLSDDSGLEVECLGNAPGVISSDWAGSNSSQEDLINKLLSELSNVPFENRTAKFVCYMLLKSPKGDIFVSRGECFGRIALEKSGSEGFGYDPLFLPQEYNYKISMADLTLEQKNKISHRQKALIGIRDYLYFLGGQ